MTKYISSLTMTSGKHNCKCLASSFVDSLCSPGPHVAEANHQQFYLNRHKGVAQEVRLCYKQVLSCPVNVSLLAVEAPNTWHKFESSLLKSLGLKWSFDGDYITLDLEQCAKSYPINTMAATHHMAICDTAEERCQLALVQ
jgi:hypothetical protein